MKKALLTLFLLTLFSFSVSAQSIDLSGVDSMIEDYNSGSLDIAQFVVYVNSYLKSQYQELEKRGHFEGFDQADIRQMFGDEEYITKQTKDFGVMFEPHESEGKYTIIWGLPPSQKAIDRAIQEAEQSYADKAISEEQADSNISKKGIQIDFHDLDIGDIICKARYDEYVKIRLLFEKAMPGFPRWYFGEFKEGADNYFSIASGHEYLMHELDSNMKGIREHEICAEDKQSIGVIEIDYETDSEKFKVWQEGDETFYEFYFMPSKEMMKEIIETKITDPTARSSGYSDSNQRTEKIRKLSDKYGGSFDAIVKIVDSEGNGILYKHVTINPDVIITSKTAADYSEEEIDVSLEIDYDRMYEYMEYISKDVQGTKAINADWDKNPNGGNMGHLFGILSKGFGMWIKGVKVKPVTEVPGLIFNLKLITEAFSD